ncbi:unnamed protein product [Chilo suppressalis]|uniref:LRRCT domain-containing protein n=1 Tax=Chilo suppressalis TaxID=168631 RepID=A0ABN8B7R1_CHISP|nr:unnamed protein product [Chilo suppressalis]
MASKVILFFIIAVVTECASSLEDDTPTDVVNITAVDEQPDICSKCICKNGKVDCSSQGLTKFFPQHKWAALKDFKPTIVDLSNNSFENITVMAELPIKVLNLSRCGIEVIQYAAFRPLRKMRVLDLSHNNLRYTPELINIDVLNLAYNDLRSFSNVYDIKTEQLTELDLSGNDMATTEFAIPYLGWGRTLKILRLRSCKLTEIRSIFLEHFTNLEYLDISDNLLTRVPKELNLVEKLLYLNINQNPIRELNINTQYASYWSPWGRPPRLLRLKELHICNMPVLTEIGPGALGYVENLEKLHLSFNPQLRHISPTALTRPAKKWEGYEWPMVKELYMKSNALSEVNPQLLSRWDLLTAIDVSGNPFRCDCDTQWMVDVLVPLIDKLKSNASEAMVCSEPEQMRGFTMRYVREVNRTMRCVYASNKNGAFVIKSLNGVLLAVPIMAAVILLLKRGSLALKRATNSDK